MTDKLPDDKRDQAAMDSPQIYLSRFSNESIPTIIFANGRSQTSPIVGEIVVEGYFDEIEQKLVVEAIRRIAFSSEEPIKDLGGNFSFASPVRRIPLPEGALNGEHEIEARLHYPLLSQELEPACQDNDAIYPILESLIGNLIWESLESEAEQPLILFQNFEMNIVEPMLGDAGISRIFFEEPFMMTFQELGDHPDLANKEDSSRFSADAADFASLTHCQSTPVFQPPNTYVHGTLFIRFVSISISKSVGMLRPFVEEWVNSACIVWWEKGGVKISPKLNGTQISIDTSNFNNGVVNAANDESSLKASVGQDPNFITIYLVDSLHWEGGGITKDCGTNSAFVVLEIEEASHNKYLLAHELGHVLGIRHPGPGGSGQCDTFPKGDYCSVMVPGKPNSNRNTKNNFDDLAINQAPSIPITAPVFVSLGKGGLHASSDQGYHHIVRDFPYDDGKEGSVPEGDLKLFVDKWWTHSDVWNATKKPDEFDFDNKYEPGGASDNMFNNNHSPKHSNAYYTTGPVPEVDNYMYVRLHACQVIPAGSNIVVDLYITPPGLGNNVVPLNGAQVSRSNPNNTVTTNSNRLTFNNIPGPQQGYRVECLKWQVTDDNPTHSCVFAVVHSNIAGEGSPIPTTSPIPLSTIRLLRASDNDVAQRNVDFTHVMSATSHFHTTTAWTQMTNILEEETEALVAIDLGLAPDLANISLEADNMQVELQPGREEGVFEARFKLSPGEYKILRIHVELPSNQVLGKEFPVDLLYFLDKELITGYRHLLQVSKKKDVVFQIIDKLAGTLRALNAAFDSEEAGRLSINVYKYLTEIKNDERYWDDDSPGKSDWTEGLRITNDDFRLLAKNLKPTKFNQVECQLIYQYLNDLAALLENKHRDAPQEFAEELRELADRIQELAGRIVRKKTIIRPIECY